MTTVAFANCGSSNRNGSSSHRFRFRNLNDISFQGNTGNLVYDQFLAHVAVVDVDANVPNLGGTNDLAIYTIQGLKENTNYLVHRYLSYSADKGAK